MVQVRQAPNTIGAGRVDPSQDDFDLFIYQHGIEVVWESAVVCPCKMDGRGFLPTCVNCAGSGWMFINPINTRMVIQSMNLNTKYKNWTKEQIGMANITSRNVDMLGDMDRLTLQNTTTKMSEIIHPRLVENECSAFTMHPVLEVMEVYRFIADTSKHELLNSSQYSFESGKNRIQFDKSLDKDDDTFTVSVRYTHPVQYHIVDLTRERRQTMVIDSLGNETEKDFPISAIGRRSHYVLRPDDYKGSILEDNSYDPN